VQLTTEQLEKLLIDALCQDGVSQLELEYVGKQRYRGSALLNGGSRLDVEAEVRAADVSYRVGLATAAPAPAPSPTPTLQYDVNGAIPLRR
jgi:hypothetical protein